MIKLLRALFFLDAAIWLAFAVAIYMHIIPGIPDQEPAVGMMAGW